MSSADPVDSVWTQARVSSRAPPQGANFFLQQNMSAPANDTADTQRPLAADQADSCSRHSSERQERVEELQPLTTLRRCQTSMRCSRSSKPLRAKRALEELARHPCRAHLWCRQHSIAALTNDQSKNVPMINEAITVLRGSVWRSDSKRAHDTRDTLVRNKMLRTLRRHLVKSCATGIASRKSAISTLTEQLSAVAKNIAELNISVVKALADATQVLRADRGAPDKQTYSPLHRSSFGALSPQLAPRISAVIERGVGTGEGPSSKVKELAANLSNRLQSQASSEAKHNSYCNEDLTKTKLKTEDLETPRTTRSSKLGAAVSKSCVLDGEVVGLQADVGALPSQQLKLDAMRAEERHVTATSRRTSHKALENTTNLLSYSNPTL